MDIVNVLLWKMDSVLKKGDVFVSVGNEFGQAQTLHSMTLVVGRRGSVLS